MGNNNILDPQTDFKLTMGGQINDLNQKPKAF